MIKKGRGLWLVKVKLQNEIGWRGYGIRSEPIGRRDQVEGPTDWTEWGVCSAGWQRWWRAARRMMGVDVPPALASLSTGGKDHYPDRFLLGIGSLVLPSPVEERRKAPEAAGGGCLAPRWVKREICKKGSRGTIMASAFNLQRQQRCHGLWLFLFSKLSPAHFKIWSTFIYYLC